MHRPFGRTGLHVPPIIFGSAALGNVRRVLTEQSKLELCGEWLRHVSPPVFVETSACYGDGMALAVLRRALVRYDAAPEEVVISLRLRCHRGSILQDWRDVCSRLGHRHSPRLAALDLTEDRAARLHSPAERDQWLEDVRAAHRTLNELKADGQLAGVGVVLSDWRAAREIITSAEVDWVTLAGGLTILRHPPELLDFIAKLAARQIACIVGGVFECGFLVGGSMFDGRRLNPMDSADGSLLAWRKSFAALCHGHGITPAHACIQFALSVPGVVSVVTETTHPDRIAENVAAATTEITSALWMSMKEEGLLTEN